MVIVLKEVSDRHPLPKTGVVLPFLTAALCLKISLMEIPLSGCLSEASEFPLQLEEKVCPKVWEAKKKKKKLEKEVFVFCLVAFLSLEKR